MAQTPARKSRNTESPKGDDAAQQRAAEEAKKTEEAAASTTGDAGTTGEPSTQKAEDKATPAAPTGEDATESGDVKYTVARLIADSYDLTGYPSHYAAGALHGHDATDELTAAGAKAAIKKWLKGEVKEVDETSEGEAQ